MSLSYQGFFYIALTDEKINNEGIGDILHTIKPGETKPKMTDQDITGGEQLRIEPKTKLLPPGRKPTRHENKKMVALAMAWLVKRIINNFLHNLGESTGGKKMEAPLGMN